MLNLYTPNRDVLLYQHPLEKLHLPLQLVPLLLLGHLLLVALLLRHLLLVALPLLVPQQHGVSCRNGECRATQVQRGALRGEH